MSDNQDLKKSYKDTLNLPKTDFPIRPDHKNDDPALVSRWESEDLFKKSYELNKGKEKYVLHDGPPYANGDIHLGHAYNKILKDITTKSYRMLGYHVPVKPGWDCHGLPIELKVVKDNPGLDKVGLKKACREYASHWIDVQRNSFKSLGVLMNWNEPYITMDYSYESSILNAFGSLVGQGFVERKNKTVPWCFNCETVLASAEIEYQDRKDPSIYVLFDLQADDSKRLFSEFTEPVSLVIWTTTPWTLPLNRAVLVNPNTDYVLLDVNGKGVVIGAKVADALVKHLEIEKKVVKTFNSSYLKGLSVNHPFIDVLVPLIFDDSVGTDEGTAFVHCAPGCGPIDYEIGVKNNLEIYSPISSAGKYTQDIKPEELAGQLVTDGQIWVIKKLAGLGKMLYKNSIRHSYPHCWRCKNGLIFRATPQWFFDLNKDAVRQRTLDAVENMNFIPETGKNFLRATVQNRWEWCLSRQRTWGVPIPALICNGCDYAYLTPEIIAKAAKGVAKEGIEYWDTVKIEELVEQGFACPECNVSDLRKEFDILDVWFESGISHYAVLYNNPELAYPADLYLEGVDQYRAWFQSSLITSLVLEKTPAMKTIMAHGFTVDAKGQKMSKSMGNVVAPGDIISKLGTDGLRLWVSSIGHESDLVASDKLFQNVSEVYRRVRNTCRFLLQNLFDFDAKKDLVPVEKLSPVDYYALTELEAFNSQMIQYYKDGDFTAVFHGLADYCTVDLSSFYLDIVKDRLYVESPSGHKRRSAQTVMWYILDTITRLMAPIMSFTSEFVSDSYQQDKAESIHLQSFVNPKDLHNLCYQQQRLFRIVGRESLLRNLTEEAAINLEIENYAKQWELIKGIRSAVLKAIEVEREKGSIKHSLEAGVTVYLDYSKEKLVELEKFLDDLQANGVDLSEFFRELLIVSQWKFAKDSAGLSATNVDGVFVKINNAEGVKCPRCWNWDVTEDSDGLCRRCLEVLK